MDRSRTPIQLTERGSQFYASVVQGFDTLQTAIQGLSKPEGSVTVVCSHSVSHLILMPRYGLLRQSLGPDVELRIMTVEYNLIEAAVQSGADIVFEYTSRQANADSVIICPEEVKPVGTPDIVAQAIKALDKEGAAPPLLKLRKDNFGWMDWKDWTKAHPEYAGWSSAEGFDSYVYMLEAAASGAGLALGWRNFVDGYIERGDLVEMPVDWFSKSTKIIARLTTPHGQNNPAAHKCLSLIGKIYPKAFRETL